MQRIIDRMRIFKKFKVYGFPKTHILTDTIGFFDLYHIQYESLITSMSFQDVAFKNISDTIYAYYLHLEDSKYASKLSYAKVLTNDGVKKIVEQYTTDFFPTTQNRFRRMFYDFTDLTQLHCEMYVRAISDSLLKAFYFKFYDHYKKTTDSERDAMGTYFDFLNDSTLSSMLVRGTVIDVKTCIEHHAEILRNLKDTTFLPKVTLFKDSMDKMESFLESARLEGNVFRYFTIIVYHSYHNYTCCLDMIYTSDTITHFDMQSPDSTHKLTTLHTPHHTTPHNTYLMKLTHTRTHARAHTHTHI